MPGEQLLYIWARQSTLSSSLFISAFFIRCPFNKSFFPQGLFSTDFIKYFQYSPCYFYAFLKWYFLSPHSTQILYCDSLFHTGLSSRVLFISCHLNRPCYFNAFCKVEFNLSQFHTDSLITSSLKHLSFEHCIHFQKEEFIGGSVVNFGIAECSKS